MITHSASLVAALACCYGVRTVALAVQATKRRDVKSLITRLVLRHVADGPVVKTAIPDQNIGMSIYQ
jgi:hypothetical protein